MTATGTENLEVMEEARKYNDLLADLTRWVAGPGQRVMDFGAGNGTFAKRLAGEGRNLVCVEPSASARACLSAAGLEAHADLAGVPDESVDGLYSLNVLEHIADDLAALRALRQRLRPGGRFLLYVPAFPWLFTAMDRRVGHLRRYRRAELVRLVTNAGFDVRHARYVDCLGVVATLAYRILGDRQGTIDLRFLKLYDRFAFPLSRRLDLLFDTVAGKNLLVMATRR